MEPKTAFVTCGATVPFPKLISSVLSEEILLELRKQGFGRLIVQFGSGYRDVFLEKLRDMKCAEAENCSLPASELGTGIPPLHVLLIQSGIEVIGFDFSSEIHDIIEKHADLVISHAGTGSILDSVRLRKPLIVCVNDNLMDNHQQEIADKFERDGYVWACKPTKSGLSNSLIKSQQRSLRSFPPKHSDKFERQLKDLAFR